MALLRQIGIEPAKTVTPQVCETPQSGELPRDFAQRMALEKLLPQDDAFVVAADTVVAVGRRMLHKTDSLDIAEQYMRLLSGRRHKVYSAVAVRAPTGKTAFRVVQSVVGFSRLEETQLQTYLASQEWQGKAGGYAIQGQAACFIDYLAGSYSGVVGLPLHETYKLLSGLGWR